MANYYVNIYIHDKAWGGREEGGWWYDVWEPATEPFKLEIEDEKTEATYGDNAKYWSDEFPLSVLVHDKYQAKWIKAMMQAWCDAHNDDRHSDIHSVVSEGRYEVMIESHKPRFSPETRPRYE